MILRRLRAVGLRNLRPFSLELPDGLVAFLGRNAQGKTSLLEGVYVLFRGYSFRTDRIEEIVGWGADGAFLSGEALFPAGGRELALTIPRGGRPRRTADGKPLRPEERGALLPRVFLFQPGDLDLVKGGPELRRRYLDEDLGVLSPAYRDERRRLQRLLREKGAALRQGAGDRVLDALDEHLFACGRTLTEMRRTALAALAPRLTALYARISDGERCTAAYRPNLAEGLCFSDVLRWRAEERRRGVPLWGPHRDDIDLRIGDNEARRFASQGQQRSLAVALKVAALEVAAAMLGERPLLLLDDVLSELDARRQEALLELVTSGQTLLTAAGGRLTGVRESFRLEGGEVGPCP